MSVSELEMAPTLVEQGDEVALLVLLYTERPRFHCLLMTEMARLLERGKHIADVLRQFLSPGEGTRRQAISRGWLSTNPTARTIYAQGIDISEF